MYSYCGYIIVIIVVLLLRDLPLILLRRDVRRDCLRTVPDRLWRGRGSFLQRAFVLLSGLLGAPGICCRLLARDGTADGAASTLK